MKPLTPAALPERRLARNRAAMLLGCALAVLSFVALTFDQSTGISASWSYCGSFIVVGVGISALTFIRYRFAFPLFAGAAFLLSILLLHYCDTTPVKPLRRLEAAIRAGMTVAEVRSAVQREFPERGRFPVPVVVESVPDSGIGQMALFSDRFSGLLSFRNGRVASNQLDLGPVLGMSLSTVATLVGACVCLIWCWQSARRLSGVKPWTGHGIELGSVAERVQRVRRDHLAEYRTSHSAACQRRSLLATAGLAVRRFPYFRGRATESSQEPMDEREKA